MPRVVSIEDFAKIFLEEWRGISFVYNNVAVIRESDNKDMAIVLRINGGDVTGTKVPVRAAAEIIRETGVDEVYLTVLTSTRRYAAISFYHKIPVWHNFWYCSWNGGITYGVSANDVAMVAVREGLRIFTPVPIATRLSSGIIVAPTHSEVEFLLRIAEVVEKARDARSWAPRRAGDKYIFGYEPIDATPVAEMFRSTVKFIIDQQLHEWLAKNNPCILDNIEVGRRSHNITWIMKTIVKYVYGEEHVALPVYVDSRIVDEIASMIFYPFDSAFDLPQIGEAALYALINNGFNVPSKIAWRRTITT